MNPLWFAPAGFNRGKLMTYDDMLLKTKQHKSHFSYIAIDENCNAWAYASKPIKLCGEWNAPTGNSSIRLGNLSPIIPWKDTLIYIDGTGMVSMAGKNNNGVLWRITQSAHSRDNFPIYLLVNMSHYPPTVSPYGTIQDAVTNVDRLTIHYKKGTPMTHDEKVAETKANGHRYFATDRNGRTYSYLTAPQKLTYAFVCTNDKSIARQIDTTVDMTGIDWETSLVDIESHLEPPISNTSIEVFGTTTIITYTDIGLQIRNINNNTFNIYATIDVSNLPTKNPWKLLKRVNSLATAIDFCTNYSPGNMYPLINMEYIRNALCKFTADKDDCTIVCSECAFHPDNIKKLPDVLTQANNN